MDITPHLAAFIREAMEQQGHTTKGLSEATGIPYSTLHAKLKGPRPFNTRELEPLAHELGLPGVRQLFEAAEAKQDAAA